MYSHGASCRRHPQQIVNQNPLAGRDGNLAGLYSWQHVFQ